MPQSFFVACLLNSFSILICDDVGVTFDSGGISIKPSAKMDAMRADMGGAACSLAAVWAAAHLQLPINIKLYIPLCENMPSGDWLRLLCLLYPAP